MSQDGFIRDKALTTRTYIKAFLNIKSGQLKDPLKLAKDMVNPTFIGHWGNGDYEIKMTDETSLEEVFKLIKQSYELGK